VLLTSTAIVGLLKHETSTLRHDFISIDFKFGVGDYVREVNSPAIVGLDPMSGQDPRICAVALLIPVNRCSRTIAQKTRSGVWKTHFRL